MSMVKIKTSLGFTAPGQCFAVEFVIQMKHLVCEFLQVEHLSVLVYIFVKCVFFVDILCYKLSLNAIFASADEQLPKCFKQRNNTQ